MLTYEGAVEWIHSRLRLGIKPGLQRMEHLLKELGQPHKTLKTIHIGGTNGKGSTVTYIRNVLEECGYTVGTFTSPYFEVFNERISTNGQPISDEKLTLLVERIKPIAEKMESSEWGAPSEFEIITAMSFVYFAEIDKVDFVLYEVGLGGRLDSTNIITPLLSIITSIGMDHMSFLGNTLAEIASEKAGIIKERVPVVSGVLQKGACAVIKQKAEEMESEVYQLGEAFFADRQSLLKTGEHFFYESSSQATTFEISMIGTHQIYNAAVAIKALEILQEIGQINCSQKEIKAGLMRAYWPGRMEKVSENPEVYMDGAHNPEGVKALVQTLKERFQHKKITVLFSALKDKQLKPMIEELEEAVDCIGFTSFQFPRVASSEELYHLSTHKKKINILEWESFIEDKLLLMDENEVLFITGSLYFLSEVKPVLMKKLENSRKNK
ncbi:bifunctional folylpolyglutamate synthase/dihydrofolate synthase [Rossellomorea aquimaris]|uniref:bifunctional folylpolyglutamate synthase/dihydrofolate synthase n=1 Tax=Rossellomorea aquimaris TaxID=189382 RepID=UPI0007D095B5|nr:folylpolyglutamate synthase/dihydrofolate synthase family protein [Rossellomorea aquimaris]